MLTEPTRLSLRRSGCGSMEQASSVHDRYSIRSLLLSRDLIGAGRYEAWRHLGPHHFISLDESQYHFHGSVMNIAEPGFEVEFATTFKFVAQLFFVILICVKFLFECKLRPHI